MSSRASKILDHLTSAPKSEAMATQPTKFYKPVKVVVTGAAGNIAYSVLFGIGRGKLLGPNTPIELMLLDIPPMEKKVQGVIMELNDCAFPLLTSITGTSDYATAFAGAEVCLLIGARPRGPGMVRADLLKANAKIFEGQGKAIDQYADRNIKVVVVGNPANTNALITMTNAPSIPRENFTALTRLDQNRAASLIAETAGVNVGKVRNIVIWGNHSKTQYPDTRNAVLVDSPKKGLCASVRSQVDNSFLDGEFIKTVQYRGAAIIKARGASSAASAANAPLDHVRSWLLGTAPGEWVSMAVCSDNSGYDVPENLVFSFPCTCSNGNWRIVPGLHLDSFSKEKVEATAAELVKERETAFSL